MSFNEIITLLIFLFPLAFSPGPGNLFFAANGARFGFSKTLLANLGYHLATIIVTLMLGFGFNLFFSFIENQYIYIKTIGSLYVIYLAYKFFITTTDFHKEINSSCTFFDGVMILVFNPKAYVIISLMFTIFLNNQQDFFKVLIISFIFTFNNFISFTLWTLFGDVIGAKFRNQKYNKIFNYIFACLLFCVGIWMLTIEIV